MTDSSDDQEKMEYVKQDLFQPISRPWQHRNQDDKSIGEDSNHMFMSEPSVSEAGSSDHHLRLLSPMESLTDDQSVDDDGLPPPPPPPRLLTAPSPASPGNTSLSSWESPHLNRRIHLHFSPDPREDRRQNPMIGQRGFIHPSHVHTAPAPARTPDREFTSDNQQSSASEVSSGQRRRADQFLRDLRRSSEGQVRESQTAANDSSFDSSYHVPNHHEGMQNVLRKTAAAAIQQEHVPSTDTEVARNTSSPSDLVFSAVTQDAHAHATDDTIVMTLSASEDERDTTTTQESGHPLDWEQQHSADDEKTAEFRPRIRFRGKIQAHRRQRSFGDGKQPGHRRQRSGDAAAATLSTGSADWKGMGQHNIPLPPVPGEEDDEDEDTTQNHEREQEREKDGKSSQSSFPKTTVDGLHDFGVSSNSAGDIAQFSKFALGDDAPAVPVARRNSRRPRRDSRLRRKSWLELDSEESSSLTSNDFSPRFSFQQTRHARMASQPPPASSYVPNSWSGDMSPYSQPSPHNIYPGAHPGANPLHHSCQFGTYQQADVDPQLSPGWRSSWPVGERIHSFDNAPANNSHHPSWYPAMQTERPQRSPKQGVGSPSSTFSWLSGRHALHAKNGELDPESLSLLEKQGVKVETVQSDNQDTSFSFHSDSESSECSDDEGRDHFIAHMNHEHDNERSMRVLRNPFEDPNKREFDRRRFNVQTSELPTDEKTFPTYICPICNTRQREFFTVSSAPKTFESASGYIAFYFSIYVIAALYLFGLQEGWTKLDCIYFAVITLTTAGLGDFVPTTDGAKVICSVFIYFGVACIGLLLGSYIAGMLDETSSRTARENRIKSCPNCARIQNIKEAAERRHASKPLPLTPNTQNSGFFAPGPVESTYERDPKKAKRQHQTPPGMNMFNSPIPQTAHTPDGRTYVVGPAQSAMHVEMSPDSSSGRHEAVQPNLTRSPALSGYSPHSTVSPMVTPGRSTNWMGSPMTTQILRRQSHSRHASFDLNGTNQFATSFKQQKEQKNPRRLSADLPATIHESEGQNRETAPPPPPTNGWFVGTGDDNDTFETESSSSDSDFDSSSDDDALKKHGIKNAKYVFVTLKEALLNSVVIITFGCMGFCFIEGFSVIDSWYFTTVLLTTVGYGDITPYTKGGKLFATIYILVAGTILLNNMSMISMIPLELRKRRTERAVLEQFGDWLDDAALRELATGPLVQRLNLSYQHPTGLDECTREMFSLAMLVRLGKVTEEDIKQTFAAFRKLDVHDEGVLNSRSIIAGMIQKHRNSSVNLKGLANASQTGQRYPRGTPLNSTDNLSGFGPPTTSWAGGYGNWYGSVSSIGSASFGYGAQQFGRAPAMSERSPFNSMHSNYGSSRSQNPFQPQHTRTGSA